MKRYGKKAVEKALKDGYYIAYFEWFTLNAGYKVIDKDRNIIGYITFDLFAKLKNDDIITAYVNEFACTVYGLVN